MGLIFWWMLLIWVIAAIAYGAVLYWRRHKHKADQKKAVPIAHSDRMTQLPEYEAMVKRYRLLLRLAVGGLAVGLLTAVVLSARPATMTFITPAEKSRDIMLCLDVSGSVLRADARLVNRFKVLVKEFSGQRFGLTVFNSSPIIMIPLSSDYEYISEQLEIVGKALTKQEGQDFVNITSGTLADFDKGTSLVNDGLTSCINNLGENPQNRSQSVILATDNESHGTPIISDGQMAALAEKQNVRIYAIDPGESETERTKDHTKLRQMAEQTGGSYRGLSDRNTVNAIIDSIEQQEADYAASSAVVAMSDTPTVFVYILLFSGFLSIIVLGRLER